MCTKYFVTGYMYLFLCKFALFCMYISVLYPHPIATPVYVANVGPC